MIHSKDSLEIFSRCQIAFSSELPKGTNCAMGTDLNLTIPSSSSLVGVLVDIGPIVKMVNSWVSSLVRAW